MSVFEAGQIASLTARVVAIQIEVEGMKAANSDRDLPSKSTAYSDEDFQVKAEDVLAIVEELHNISIR